MEVLTLTTLFSVLFAVLFFALFLWVRRSGESTADQDSLIPFRGDAILPPERSTPKNDPHLTDRND